MRDWHIHLERGPYTVEWAEQFVRRAEKLGIREICLLEHSVRFLSSTPPLLRRGRTTIISDIGLTKRCRPPAIWTNSSALAIDCGQRITR